MERALPLDRRTVLMQSLVAAGVLGARSSEALAAPGLQIENVTQLYHVEVARVVAPRNTGDVSSAVLSWPGQVAVGGERFSMGGQVAVRGGLHIDMRQMNGLVWLRPADRAVRV